MYSFSHPINPKRRNISPPLLLIEKGRSQTIPFNPPGSALYLAVVDGRQAGRFIINR